MLVNYRHYKLREMIELLTKERIYFSRGHSAVRGRHAPDTIYLTAAAGGDNTGTITIGCEFYTNNDGVREILEESHFFRDEANGRFLKVWPILFNYSLNSLQLLNQVLSGLDEAMESSPFLLYASPQQKALADYYRFMTMPLPKVSCGAVMHELGYWDDPRPAIGEKETDADTDFMVAPYKRRWWAAWASGDHIVPLFTLEAEAVRFLRQRAACNLRGKISVRPIPACPPSKRPNPYVLVDHTRSKKEKVAWLRSEIARLCAGRVDSRDIKAECGGNAHGEIGGIDRRY
ncbi:MAG TPA: hypothetical protein VN521_06280 [Negativicutes bacterium]|nr:hypothetical protein [Negativicutes bacterium]